MNKMTKKDRFKKFVKDNEDLIATGTAIAAGLGVLVAFVAIINHDEKVQIEEYNAWVEKENQFLEQQASKGNDVYYLADGHVLTVPEDAPVKYWQRPSY